MKRAALALPIVALAAAAVWMLRPTTDARPRVQADGPVALNPHATSQILPTSPQALTGAISTWQLRWTRGGRMGAQTIDPQIVTGEWRREALADGRIEVRFLPDSASGSQVPPLDALRAVLQIKGARVGFEGAPPPPAQRLLATIATALQFTDGQGAAWTAEEDDVDGRAVSEYRRARDGSVTRTRTYQALRQGGRLDPKRAHLVTVEGDTRYVFDDQGLARVTLAETHTLSISQGKAAAVQTVKAELVRVDHSRVALRGGPYLPLRGLRGPEALSQRDRDEAVARAFSVADLASALDGLEGLKRGSPQASQLAGGALTKMASVLRARPESTAALVAELRARAEGDPRQASVITGALAAAGTPEANAALIALMDDEFPTHVRRNVAASLGISKAPSAEGLSRLQDAIGDEEFGSTAALAAGNQARALADAEPEPVDDAVADLLARYEAAEGYNEKRLYLQALANTGDVRAFPHLAAAAEGTDSGLAHVGAFGMRFMALPEADAVLRRLIAPQNGMFLRLEAVRAVAWRNPAEWQPVLEAAMEAEPNEDVRAAMRNLVRRWS